MQSFWAITLSSLASGNRSQHRKRQDHIPTAQAAAAETFCAQSDLKELKNSSFFRVGELLTGDQVLYDVLARGESE